MTQFRLYFVRKYRKKYFESNNHSQNLKSIKNSIGVVSFVTVGVGLIGSIWSNSVEEAALVGGEETEASTRDDLVEGVDDAGVASSAAVFWSPTAGRSAWELRKRLFVF